jgi:hypothetical protein
MKQLVVAAFAFGLLTCVNGCGGMKGESETKEGIQILNDTADAIEKKDEAKLKELKKKGEDLKKKMDDLKLSDDEKKKLDEKYKADGEKAMKRVEDAMKKAAGG